MKRKLKCPKCGKSSLTYSKKEGQISFFYYCYLCKYHKGGDKKEVEES